MKKILLFFLLINCFASAQETGYYDASRIRYEDFVYAPYIRTVTLYKEGFELSFPAIEMNTGDRLVLGFDDLESGLKNYYYTLVHCDAQWNPSDLFPAQYIEGFNEDAVTSYQHSFNTIQRFTHYTLRFPNEYLRPVLSGNYIIKVYIAGQPDKPVLTRRFMIYENKVTVDASVQRPPMAGRQYFVNQVDLTIGHPTYPILNPLQEVKVAVLQNGRWDNMIIAGQPDFISEGILTYNVGDDIVFPSGNQFRWFEIRNMKFTNERIVRITYDTLGNHVFIEDDIIRANRPYITDRDINGRFIIRTHALSSNETEADYAWVHFRLPYPSPVTNGNFYVMGAFNGWRKGTYNMMRYNEESRAYEATLFLKQGYYNYTYVFAGDQGAAHDPNLVEGNFFETENEYSVFVYHRDIRSRYDRLIGFTSVNTSGLSRR